MTVTQASKLLGASDGLGPLAYLVTFRCYGTWLHGDSRGSIDPKHNQPGAPVLPPNPARQRSAAGRLKHAPLTLDANRRAVVDRTIREVCRYRSWSLISLNVRSNHVHVIARTSGTPERAMNEFKSWSTRRMVEAGIFPPQAKAWSRHGSTEYLWTAADVERACRYVAEGQGPDLSMTSSPLPDGRGTVDRSAEVAYSPGSSLLDGRGTVDRSAEAACSPGSSLPGSLDTVPQHRSPP